MKNNLLKIMIKDYYTNIVGKIVILLLNKYNFFLLIENYINLF